MLTGCTSRRTLVKWTGASLAAGTLGAATVPFATAQSTPAPAATTATPAPVATPTVTVGNEPVPDLAAWVIQPNEIGKTYGLGSATIVYAPKALVDQHLFTKEQVATIQGSFRLAYSLTTYRPPNKQGTNGQFGRAVYAVIVWFDGKAAASGFFDRITKTLPPKTADVTGSNKLGDGKTAIWATRYLQQGTNAIVDRLAVTFLVGPALCFLTIDGIDGTPSIADLTKLGQRFAERVTQGQQNKRFGLGWAALRLTSEPSATFALTRVNGANVPIFNEPADYQQRRAFYNDGAVTVLENDFSLSPQTAFGSALFEFPTEDEAGIYNGRTPQPQLPTFQALGINVVQNYDATSLGDASKAFWYSVAIKEKATRFGYLQIVRVGPIVLLADLLDTATRTQAPPASAADIAKTPKEITALWATLDRQLTAMLKPWAAQVGKLAGKESDPARFLLFPPLAPPP